MNQVKIGQFIAKLRKERGFLQKDIAERLGILLHSMTLKED